MDDSEDRQTVNSPRAHIQEEQGSERTGLPLVEFTHPLSLGHGVLRNVFSVTMSSVIACVVITELATREDRM